MFLSPDGASVSRPSCIVSSSKGSLSMNDLNPESATLGSIRRLVRGRGLCCVGRWAKSCCCEGRSTELPLANKAQNAVVEFAITAIHASISPQKKIQTRSCWPLSSSWPTSRMTFVKMAKALRQSSEPRPSFRRRLILTFHRKRIGIEITESNLGLELHKELRA